MEEGNSDSPGLVLGDASIMTKNHLANNLRNSLPINENWDNVKTSEITLQLLLYLRMTSYEARIKSIALIWGNEHSTNWPRLNSCNNFILWFLVINNKFRPLNLFARVSSKTFSKKESPSFLVPDISCFN